MPSCAGCTRSVAAEDSRASSRRGAHVSPSGPQQETCMWSRSPEPESHINDIHRALVKALGMSGTELDQRANH